MAQTTTTETWISAVALTAATGLTPSQIVQFIPATPSPSGPMYNQHQAALAAVVRNLIAAGAPDPAIHAAVADLNTRPYDQLHHLASRNTNAGSHRPRGLWIAAAAGGAVVTAVITGLIGNVLGATGDIHTPAVAPNTITVTAEASSPPLPVVPSKPDPVCAEWSPMATDYASKLAEWAKGDPAVPSSRWSAEERAQNFAAIPTIRAQAKDMRRLAKQAQDAVLRSLMLSQAAYEEAYADRVPTYAPDDQRLWQAAINFSAAVKSQCTALAPR
ncbi:MAG: hypothetical protein K0U78_17270 [Actinomycetia bacterium]|nr:hypothetical protein [Actinomycetes bacterium]